MLSSIHNFYQAVKNNDINPDLTIPAINIRALTYDTATLIFKIAKAKNIGAFILEIAQSEMEYTNQPPIEYAQTILQAAKDENFDGPLFLQGDHFQASAAKFLDNPQNEIQRLKDLIKNSIAAGFYNIDIDASTLVDLTKENVFEQQKNNAHITAQLTKYIREIEEKKVISIGGEIGHIGDKNSTTDDLNAFMDLYLQEIGDIKSINKISIQTGSSHGGTVLPNGQLKTIAVDFEIIQNLGKLAREKYNLAGVVQHGASTLSPEMFHLFPKNKTLEIHLATGFQNIVFDNMPASLRDKICVWVSERYKNEWKKEDTKEQFLYKNRKRALGFFQKDLNNLTLAEKEPILKALEKQFLFLFEELNVFNTKDLIKKYV